MEVIMTKHKSSIIGIATLIYSIVFAQSFPPIGTGLPTAAYGSVSQADYEGDYYCLQGDGSAVFNISEVGEQISIDLDCSICYAYGIVRKKTV